MTDRKRNTRWTIAALILAVMAIMAIMVAIGRGPDDGGVDDSDAPEVRAPPKTGVDRSEHEPEPPRTIVVEVVERSGRALATARVCLIVPAHADGQRCTSTDARGLSDDLELPIGERWRIAVSAPGFRPSTIPVLGELEPTESRVRVILNPGGVRLSGRVEDATGGVIEGALVSVEDVGMVGMAADLSGPGGEFEVWGPAGQVAIRAVAEGYAASEEHLTLPSGPVVLRLLPESTIAGRVLDAESGEPIADAIVVARRSDDDGRSRADDERASTRSDAEGHYRIGGMSAGAFQVTTQGPWGYGTSEGAVVVQFAERREGVDLLVHHGTTVIVDVVRVESGDGCPGAWVRLTQEDLGHAIAVTTDVLGHAELALPIAGEYQVAVACEGHRPVEPRRSIVVSGSRDERTLLRIEVDLGLVVQGRVVEESTGKPIPDAVVGMISRSSSSSAATVVADGEGRFEATGLAAGKYVALASAPGRFPLDTPTELTLPTTAEIEIPLRSGGALVGRVVEKDGTPATDARVLVQRHASNGRFRGETLVDDEGRFAFDSLPPGEYGVDVTGATGQSLIDASSDRAVQASVVIDADERRELEFVVAGRDGAITGRVVASDGEPLASAFVCAEPSELPPGAVTRRSCSARMTEVDGSFVIEGLQAGRYTLVARIRGGGEARRSEVAIGDDVELVVQGTGTITGSAHYAREGGVPDMLVVEAVRSDAEVRRREAFLRSEGRWSITGLPPGDYAIRIHASAGSGVAEGRVDPDRDTDVGDVMLDDRTSLSGRVVRLEDSTPLAGFRVVATALDAQMRSRYVREDARNISDAQGRFVVADPPTGRVTLHVIPENLDARPPDLTEAHVTVTVDPGNPLEVGDVAIPTRRLASGQTRAQFGFTLKRWDHVGDQADQDGRVEAIVAGGPADRAGLQVDDMITVIDGFDVVGRRYLLQYRLLAPVGTAITIDTQRVPGLVIQGE
jgi:protocatechuate 3,4-dioxygenase beta subunit